MTYADFVERTASHKIAFVDITHVRASDGLDPQTLRVSTHHYADDNGLEYDARITRCNITKPLTSGNELRGRAAAQSLDLELISVGGLVESLQGRSVQGQQVIVYQGGDELTHGQYQRTFTGEVQSFGSVSGAARVRLRAEAVTHRLEAPYQATTFDGTGRSITFNGTDSLLGAATLGAVDEPSTQGYLCCEVRFKPTGAVTGNEWLIRVAGGWDMFFNAATRRVSFRVRDSTNVFQQISSPLLGPFVDADTWQTWTGVWDYANDDFSLFKNGIAVWEQAAGFDYRVPANSSFRVGEAGGANYYEGDVCFARWWIDGDARSRETIERQHRHLLDTQDANLVEELRMEEGPIAVGGATNDWAGAYGDSSTFGSVDIVREFSLTNTAWSHTREGDPSMARLPKPQTWGRVRHRFGILVSGDELIYQVNPRSVEAFDGVYEGALKLEPNYAVTSTNISFDNQGTIQLIQTTADDFRSLAPGQSVSVVGSVAANNGTFTVTSVDEEAGTWVAIDNPAMVDAAAGASITFGTALGTHAWTDTLASGWFQLENAPTFPITCAVRGDNEGGYQERFQALAENWLNSLALDVGTIGSKNLALAGTDYLLGFATDLEFVDATEILDAMAASVCATWGYLEEEQTIFFQTFDAPEVQVGLGSVTTWPVTDDELVRISEQDVTPARLTTKMVWQRNFAKLGQGDVAQSVRNDQTPGVQDWVAYVQGEGRNVENTPQQDGTGTVEEVFGSSATGVDEFVSWLGIASEAQDRCDREFAKHGAERRSYRLDVKLQPTVYEPKKLVVDITSGQYAQLTTGRPTIPVKFTITPRGVSMEVWG